MKKIISRKSQFRDLNNYQEIRKDEYRVLK